MMLQGPLSSTICGGKDTADMHEERVGCCAVVPSRRRQNEGTGRDRRPGEV